MKIIIIIFLQVGRLSRLPRGVKLGLDSPDDLFGGKCIRIKENLGKNPAKGSEKNESKETREKSNRVRRENFGRRRDEFSGNPRLDECEDQNGRHDELDRQRHVEMWTIREDGNANCRRNVWELLRGDLGFEEERSE